MATLNTSSNGPNIKRSYENVVNSPPPKGPQANSPTFGQWAVFTVAAPLVSAFQHDGGKESVLKVQTTGEGELADLIDEFSDGRIQFAFVKVKDPNTSLPKNVLIAWCGEGVPERTKGYFGSHLGVVSKLLHGYHVQVTARSDADLTPERIVQKVSEASGANYSGTPSIPSANKPLRVAAKKPVFTPTQIGGGGAGFNPLGRSRAALSQQDTGADGWGADAPEVTRSQLEKVESAYKPTKVNMAELTSRKPETSRFQASDPKPTPPDVVRGTYQPIGKVDIAALRAQAISSAQDDRPTVVKGAYEPVGKVDIAAIRAKAQAAPPSSGLSPAATGASTRSEENDETPKSLAERSAAFKQPERLTSLPKPKVANKFGGASAFTGTKAPTPSAFGVKPAIQATAPIGSASKTFADQGGKTPAQLWAEKKAAQGQPVKSFATGESATSPLQAQKSGGWQSGYTGKSWAPVQTTRTGQSATSNLSEQRTGGEAQQEEAPSSPAGGIGALKDRFKGAAPMGAPTSRSVPEPSAPSPPVLDTSSKPNAGGRGVPIPGLPSRRAEREAEDDVPAEQHQRLPSPPPQPPRSPSPEPSGSPVRIAMPVGRSAAPAELSPAQEQPPPMPTRGLSEAVREHRDISPERQVESEDTARGAGAAVAAATFGAGAVAGAAVGAAAGAAAGGGQGGKRAIANYDYEKAEDNELELREGEYVTDIDMVDEDWWMGTNSRGEQGLFPSNYVELVEDDAEDDAGAGAPPPLPSHPAAEEEPPAGPPQPAGGSGATATASYDYEAAEDNELSFPEDAIITNIEFPDEDWWLGTYNGKSGLFPANYVQLNE
ncbi:hypothetical protein BU23DRAFT_66357 [Bimuria novae-zelandiae CBS 107.79]|uniref:Actin binding protein-like protein n=1 Tax=Bimuria novae-zelandiae CBS 107.79 TaxID=1447943 RepID=A0A6A5VEW9_9PLEO|nr:hypothetical protein BU23DRAFT_66357 [Bimuria novae-zelandiae CBS 107.79]